MAAPIQVSVNVKGPLFSKRITANVREAMYEEGIKKITDRWMRKSRRRLGRRKNILSLSERPMRNEVRSTLIQPRTSGKAWMGSNIAIAKAMAPRVLRKAAKRITGQL